MKNRFVKRFCLILAAIVLICYGSAAIILKVSGFSLSNVINNGDLSFNINDDFFNHNGFGFGGKYNTYALNDEVNESMDGVDNVHLSFVGGDVLFHDSDENKLKVVLSGNMKTSLNITTPKLESSKDGSTLNVSIEKNSFLGLGSYSFNSKVDVYVPKNYSKNLSIDTVSADIKLSDKKLINLEANTTSGEINLSNITTDSLKLKTVSGDIQGNNVITNKSEFNTVSGEVRLDSFEGITNLSTVSADVSLYYNKIIGNINIHSTSGEVRLRLPEDCSFQLDSSSTSGDISSNFSLDNLSNSKRSLRGAYGNGNNKLSIHTTSGDISINKN